MDLPYARATIKVEMKAALAPTDDGLKKESAALKNSLALVDVPYSDAAKQLASDFDAIVGANASACLSAAPPASCLSTLSPEFLKKYDGQCSGCTEEEGKARRLVDTKYRGLAASVGAEEFQGTAELRNVPLTRYSFGVMTGLSFWRSTRSPRVKVDEGLLEADPLDRQLTMVTLNGAFRHYDADAFSITRAERRRWVVGAVVTPTFGIGIGYSHLIVRGLGLNAGYALLGISTAAGGKKVGEAPESDGDPFKFGVAGTAFLGLSYSFK